MGIQVELVWEYWSLASDWSKLRHECGLTLTPISKLEIWVAATIWSDYKTQDYFPRTLYSSVLKILLLLITSNSTLNAEKLIIALLKENLEFS